MRLRDRRVQIRYPLRLTCQIIGTPTPRITWFNNEEKIVESERCSIIQDDNFYTLEINQTTIDDLGTYKIVASNIHGSVSCCCKIIIDKGKRAYKVPEFNCKLNPDTVTVSENTEVRLSAQVEAYPSASVIWYKNGVSLHENSYQTFTINNKIL